MKRKSKFLTGINIQWPWSFLLVSGSKAIETRSYQLPTRLIGVELAVIETPGPRGKKDAGILKARIIGTIVFSGSYKYKNKRHWRNEASKHLVPLDDDLYDFDERREKWGWIVSRVEKLDSPAPPPAKRGIIFAKDCKVPARKLR